MDPDGYAPEHRKELEELRQSHSWCGALSSNLIETVKANLLKPGTPRSFVDTVFDQLLMLTLLIFIGEGVRDALDPRKALA